MVAIFWLLNAVLDIYWWLIIISVVMSWLFAFNVINYSNQFVRSIADMVHQLTEPVLSRVRKFMPNMGTIDISPIVVLLFITFLQIFLRTTVAPAVGLGR